ncbi:hypothetical protein SARC_08709 [Sphaeroforma arctica JP610]|uniref:Glycerol-3-phosphate dehydrogenase [NAD(+)] n=1 Tax=Sphaeroforma arctica JP610 TaxID=667725 RepID=A0A0L0FQP8_9EUKA|nr:hypothetical protein SARC_08709 [Sphaeroforma arctica JP610]KNC78871.1 hypothetical protein SARC_08709 [Sphaeroforma arctica JP610]|eukprot:XP_014152773.1 hypothetical protein SARC_08709 [Sphaeroforma arctica JP610]
MTGTRKPKRVTVVGGGAFGTALAQLCGRQGVEVRMWVMEEHARDAINNDHENKPFLPGCPLSDTITAHKEVSEALVDTEMVLFVIPTPFFRSFLVANRTLFPVDVPLVLCSKGIENDSLDTPYEIASEELPGKYLRNLACISGPSFALEVAQNQPTSVTCAAVREEIALTVQHYLSDIMFRVYVGDDIIGAELAGAVKNVLAIACGASDGFGFGYDARAALITRGLAELRRLVVAKGGKESTLMGLAGVGDLVLTCTGTLSRNYQTGKALAEGKSIDDIRNSSKAIAEGVFTAKSIYQMQERTKVDMPICGAVYKVIYEGCSIKDALHTLQSRELKKEGY